MLQFKICLLGTTAVGKTSLVRRYVHGVFSDDYLTTIGVKIDRKTVTANGLSADLMVWDLYGDDRFQRLTTRYLRGAAAYLLVVDGTRRTTLEAALSLHERAQEALGAVPFVLLVNKSDLQPEWEVTEADLEPLRAQSWPVLETSAKLGTGVEEAFEHLATDLIT